MLLKITRISAVFLIVVLLAGCGILSSNTPTVESSPTPVPPTSTPSPTPVPAKATVNGEIIPLAEFNSELERFKAAQAELGEHGQR